MAFAIDCVLPGYEFRGYEKGKSKKGNDFMTVRVESMNGRTAELSCTKPDLFPVVESLERGEFYDFKCAAVATFKGNNFIALNAITTPSGVQA